eukprot:sb/3463421/
MSEEAGNMGDMVQTEGGGEGLGSSLESPPLGGGEGGEGFGEAGGGGEMEGGEEGAPHPSLANILEMGYPGEWTWLVGIGVVVTIVMSVLFIRAFLAHKKYSTKHTLQFISTMGILMVYPLYSLMYTSGMLIPRANSKCTFIAETYESLSLLLFLKLLMVYMGGKRATVKRLKGQSVLLNSPPFCCLGLIPPVKFSALYLFINEIFVAQLILIELVMGYIDLLMNMDGSKTYPAALVEETYSHVFHGIALGSLLLAVYGLSSIYHCAEKELKHYNIFKKFISYKIVVTLAKVQDILFTVLSKNEVFGKVEVGAFSTHLRHHMWASTLTIIECTIIFPFALRVFPLTDYPSHHPEGLEELEEVEGGEGGQLVPVEDEKRSVLFLTDSLLSTFSSGKFTGDLTCTKKGLYRLSDIRRFASELPCHDYVVVSAGIHDLYTSRISVDQLIGFSVDFYQECLITCPHTKFIFVSLLPTGFEWLNNTAEDYNSYIFELSLRFPNLLFYDNYRLAGKDILQEDGIHVTDYTVKFIARALVRAVTNLSQCYNDPAHPWPLRPTFARKAMNFKSGEKNNGQA